MGDTIFSSLDCVNVDDSGKVWAASGPLVVQRTDGEWETHPSVDGLPLGFDTERIVPGPDGTVWCGGFRGGLSGYRDGEWKTLKTKDWLPDNTVMGTAEAKDGSLFKSSRKPASRVSTGRRPFPGSSSGSRKT